MPMLPIRSMLRILGAALLVALPTAGAAQLVDVDTEPARPAGAVSCPTKFPAGGGYEAAFLHVFNLTCYACPDGFRRTINPDVLARTACEKPARRVFSRATRHGGATGLLKTDCPDGQFWHVGDGFCYSCPSDYGRTTRSIGSSEACARRMPAQNAAAVERGAPGCGEGSFRHMLSDSCWSCPPGYGRSAAISLDGDLSELDDACVRISFGGPANPLLDDRHASAVEDALSGHVALLGQAAEVVAALLPRMGELAAAIDADRPLSESFRAEVGLNELADSAEDEGFSAISIGIVGDISIGMGGSFGAGFAHSTESWDGAWTYSGNAWSICCSLGGDIAPEIGFWKGDPTTLAGDTHGATIGGSFGYGVAAAAWFGYCPPNAEGLCVFEPFLGFTVMPQMGYSAELEYVRGATRASRLVIAE